MDAALIASIVVAVMASSGLWTFLQFMFSRKDKKADYLTKDELKKIPETCVINAEVTSVKKDTEKLKADVDLLKLGMQALLRDQLVHSYNKWTERGYAPIYARENFQNMYDRYHELGADGVITDICNRFFELPTEPPVVITNLSLDDVE